MLLLFYKQLLNLTKIFYKILLYLAVLIIIVTLFYKAANKEQMLNKTAVRQRDYNLELAQKAIKNVADKLGPNTAISIEQVYCTLTGYFCESTNNKPLTYYLSKPIELAFSNLPPSGTAWTLAKLKEVNLIPKTYAQTNLQGIITGTGLTAILPIYDIWAKFRNLAFFVLILASMFIGFIILFGVPIGTQTEITLQTILPRIVITIILIYLSFPIVGFLIDVMYITTGLSISIFYKPSITDYINNNQQLINNVFQDENLRDEALKYLHGCFESTNQEDCIKETETLIQQYLPEVKRSKIREVLNAGVWDVFKIINQPGPAYLLTESYINLLPLEIRKYVEAILVAASGLVVYTLIAGSTNIAFNLIDAVAKLIGKDGISGFWKVIFNSIITIGLLPLAIFLIATISILFLSFAISGFIIYNYLLLIFYTMFAPILILPNVIPGNNAFSSWIKKIIATLIIFPVTVSILMVANYIMTDLPSRGGFFLSPLGIQIETFTLPILIGFALIFSIPKIATKLRSMLGLQDTGVSEFNIFAPLKSVPALIGFKDVAKRYLQTNPLLEKIGEKTGLIKHNEVLDAINDYIQQQRQQTIARRTSEIIEGNNK
ncbi:MAG: hypothetical protein KatS3mg090_0158 [Patescibacteria group bacterium]|nr:MAG: hypothetical protein KatS3mg090_0158 [Patescibacteria group bacterium]